MFKRAFYPGRFQPFHLGHLKALEYTLKHSKEAIIGVSSSQYNFFYDDPFTAGERIEMIRLAIGELYSKVYIIPIENISNNNLWIPHILSLVPPFDVVYANNKLVELLFKLHNFRVENILWQKIDGIKISSRMIRRLIVEEKIGNYTCQSKSRNM